MIYVKVNDTLYPASIAGKIADKEWDGRETKSITMTGSFSEIDFLFQDDTPWSIVSEDTVPVFDEEGNPVLDEHGEQTYETIQTAFDNSEFHIRGDLTVHGNGTCTVKMGKNTELEMALKNGGTADFEEAYIEGVNSI